MTKTEPLQVENALSGRGHPVNKRNNNNTNSQETERQSRESERALKMALGPLSLFVALGVTWRGTTETPYANILENIFFSLAACCASRCCKSVSSPCTPASPFDRSSAFSRSIRATANSLSADDACPRR